MTGKYGKTAATLSPTTKLFAALAIHPELSPPPVSFNGTGGIAPDAWRMMLNDRLGCCTIATIGHQVMGWSAQVAGKPLIIPDLAIQQGYSAVTGYDPRTGANDNGANVEAVLDYAQTTGIGGRKILGRVAVDWHNPTHLKQAICVFGSVYIGTAIPRTAESQFDQYQPWTVPYWQGVPIVGLHAVPIVAFDANFFYPVTWSRLQPMTPEFLIAYGDEVFGVISPDYIDATGHTPGGLDVAALEADFPAVVA